MSRIDALEQAIHDLLERFKLLRQQCDALRIENQQLKAHLEMIDQENTHAQQALARYEQLKKTHQVVGSRVEKALQTLAQLEIPESE